MNPINTITSTPSSITLSKDNNILIPIITSLTNHTLDTTNTPPPPQLAEKQIPWHTLNH